MLELRNIVKEYKTGDTKVTALNGVSMQFRKNEFVSILGASGCGKTTLLNIVGGLDRYTSGDLIINGVSTKLYRDSDWDSYRNHSVGFVFQSYNLIPHQSVLSNVELALTLSGVSKAERRARAKEALEQVGLGDQLHKKPNQMSGGQMQRVAIARALVNNPDILLADEPTGALDTTTSVQIMELLKEVAKDRLVIMVTHNPELAEEYSTRIIRLRDGELIGDSNPLTEEELASLAEAEEKAIQAKGKKKKEKTKKTSMSFLTALSLSLNNLLTKKGRTVLTSFAGSIGIIGIALILSVSTGVNAYITDIEHSTMSSYPLQIQRSTMDTMTMLTSLMEATAPKDRPEGEKKVYSNDIMTGMMQSIASGVTTNNMKDFKHFIDEESKIGDYATDIKYSYQANLNTYSAIVDENGVVTYRKNLNGLPELMEEIGMGSMMGTEETNTSTNMMGGNPWSELVGDEEYILSQYEIVDGHLPKNANQVVLIVDRQRQVSDYILYTIGLRDVQEIKDYLKSVSDTDKTNDLKLESTEYTFDEIYGHKFRVLLDSDYYELKNGKIEELTDEQIAMKVMREDTLELEIVGIICPAEDAVTTTSIGCIGYTADLMPSLIQKVNDSDVVKAQLADENNDLFTGTPFGGYGLEDVPMLRQMMKLNPEMIQWAAGMGVTIDILVDNMTDAEVLQMMSMSGDLATYEENLAKLGYVDMADPNTILIYPKDFESKDEINRIISEYNAGKAEEDQITYTDTVALLMSSVTTIVNAISYVLIAFVAISLIVSSIMIGIITYISVLERTKEIGILRAIGASKKDISRVFNAETLIVGFCAGAIGILMTLFFNVIINVILFSLTEIAALRAVLPLGAAFILVGISMLLTFIAGLIPSKFASKKDPVVALRTE